MDENEVCYQDDQMLFFRREGWGTVPSTVEQARKALEELTVNPFKYNRIYKEWLEYQIRVEYGECNEFY